MIHKVIALLIAVTIVLILTAIKVVVIMGLGMLAFHLLKPLFM
jgi:hypothetical protein